jgi:hypothetical protein
MLVVRIQYRVSASTYCVPRQRSYHTERTESLRLPEHTELTESVHPPEHTELPESMNIHLYRLQEHTEYSHESLHLPAQYMELPESMHLPEQHTMKQCIYLNILSYQRQIIHLKIL